MSKYNPLADYFRELTGSQWHASFEQIEAILGFCLPASARNHAAWWANSRDGMPQKSAWMDAGWVTQDLNQTAGHVTFIRIGANAYLPATAATNLVRPVQKLPEPEAAPPHAWDTATQLACAIGFSWTPLGQIRVARDRKLEFPVADAVPGIYRFRIRLGETERRYIGQTENLARRFGFYRNPGPGQQTNVRLNDEFLSALGSGADVGVSIVGLNAWIDWGAGRQPADFSSHATRCLFENAAILEGHAAPIKSLNRSLGQGN